MNRKNWPVAEHGVRPAGKPDECFYCHAKLGEQHHIGCVIRSKTVVCKLTIEFVREVPEDWDSGNIDFAMNESSSCSDNLLREISELSKRTDDIDDACFCNCVHGEFVREATAEDEKLNQLFVDMLPS